MLKQIPGQMLVWFGIVGGALTVVNNWSNFITLADWTHWLVIHFSEIMYRFWNDLANLLGYSVSRGLSLLLSFIFFYICITVGTKLNAKQNDSEGELCNATVASMFMEIMYLIILAIFLEVYSGASDQSNLWIFLFVIIFTASLINVVYWRARSIISQMRTSNGYLNLMTLLVAIGCIIMSH